MDWNKKPYHSLDYEMKRRFGTKVYKIALEGGMTCPNRDGTIGTGGCIFCSAGGSGDFAVPLQNGAVIGSETGSLSAGSSCITADLHPFLPDEGLLEASVHRQIELAVSRISRKMGSSPGAYIAYFQSYTNTYAPVSYLRRLSSGGDIGSAGRIKPDQARLGRAGASDHPSGYCPPDSPRI